MNLSKIFPSILPANDENHTKLVDELTDFQLASPDELPSRIDIHSLEGKWEN